MTDERLEGVGGRAVAWRASSWWAQWAVKAVNAYRLRHRPQHLANIRAARAALRRIRSFEGEHYRPRTIAYLRAVDPLVFEEIVLCALERRGALVLRNTRYSGDGGLDGQFYLRGVGRCALQAKRYGATVSREHLEVFRHGVVSQGFALGLFVHTGRSGSALKSVGRDDRVLIVSGSRLADLVCAGAGAVSRAPDHARAATIADLKPPTH
jgi:restriction system protein